MFLAAYSRYPPELSTQYNVLLKYFQLPSLEDRRTQLDLTFLHSILNSRIDSPYHLSRFSVHVPPRALRRTPLLNVPYARIQAIQSSLFVRLPKTYNENMNVIPNIDIFHQNFSQFKSCIKSHICPKPRNSQPNPGVDRRRLPQ